MLNVFELIFFHRQCTRNYVRTRQIILRPRFDRPHIEEHRFILLPEKHVCQLTVKVQNL